MIRVRPLDWNKKGSHLFVAHAMGITYSVTGSPLRYTTIAHGVELYQGDDLEAAQKAAQEFHDKLVLQQIETDDEQEVPA